jgi:dienelactone hydrolase
MSALLIGEISSTNTKNAKGYCRRIVAEGDIPIAPHLLFPQFMDDNIDAERERAMEMNLEIMRHSDEVRVFGGIRSASVCGRR